MTTQKRIFISHSSKDEGLVDKLVDLLQTGCNIAAGHALCTTLKGLGIEIGTEDYIRFLKEELCNASLVVLVLSPNYLASHFCLCELGGTWALNLPILPLVVPPLKKSEVKATLAVTQSGLINDDSALDELRDQIKKLIGTEAPTPRWNAKRDQFLSALPPILKLLPPPDTVPFAKLKALEENYEAAQQDILEKDSEIDTLHLHIKDLEACKDAEQVKAVARKYSTFQEEFDDLCDHAATALGEVKPATQSALYWASRDESYAPDGDDEWKDASDAEAIKEITIIGGEGCRPDDGHPRVRRAQKALEKLQSFIRNARFDPDFSESFEEENDFPLDFGNKEFWSKFLASV